MKRVLMKLSVLFALLMALTFVITGAASAAVTSSTASASSCNKVATYSWSNNCQVSEGNISNFVVAIQTAVNESGTKYKGHTCSTGSIDGDFGPNTFNGVECFQGAKNIGIDGIVGPQTWGKLYELLQHSLTDSGFAYYFIGNSSHDHIAAFRISTSTGVWGIWFEKAKKYCEMNLSSPC